MSPDDLSKRDPEGAFGVVVNPAGWQSPKTELAKLVCSVAAANEPPLVVSQVSALAKLLDGGPTTVFHDLDRETAKHAVERLTDRGIDSKLVRLAVKSVKDPAAFETPARLDDTELVTKPDDVVGWTDIIPDTPALSASDRETADDASMLSQDNSTSPVNQAAAPEGDKPIHVSSSETRRETATPLPGEPIPMGELLPSPWLAGLLSALAPGAGQIYLNRTDQAKAAAMSAPLVVPWVRSVLSAVERARALHTKPQLLIARPRLREALIFLVLFWTVVAGLVVSSVALHDMLLDSSENDVVENPLVDPDSQQTDPRSADAVDSGPVTSQQLESELAQRENQVEARQLVQSAQQACLRADFQTCVNLAGRARLLDPELLAATRLYHRASLELQRGTGPGVPYENDVTDGGEYP